MTDDFFRACLAQMIDLKHPLAMLVNGLPWTQLEAALEPPFAHKRREGKRVEDKDLFGPTLANSGAGVSAAGRPRLSIRLMASLLDLKHAFNPSVEIIRRGKYKSLTRQQRRWLKRRQAVEPAIGHLKSDNRMDRYWLQGQLGDALHAVLCAAGYNLRWLLRAMVRLGLRTFLLRPAFLARWVRFPASLSFWDVNEHRYRLAQAALGGVR